MTEHTDNIKNALDFVAIFSTIGTFLNLLTPVFGLIGAVVGVMRIYEMVTGKEVYTLFSKKKDGDAEHE
jgi:flagellar motor component MotA